MKTRLTLIALFCALLNGFSAEDKRFVTGQLVDLGPVQEWLAQPVGQRPMKHWKQVQVFELMGNLGGFDRCMVLIERGAKEEILVNNLPRNIRQFLQSLSQQEAAIVSLRQQIKAYTAERDRLYTIWHNNGRVERQVSVTSSSGNGTFEDSEDARYARYEAAKRNLAAQKDKLSELEGAYQNALERNKEQTTGLAMFSGRIYTKLQVWDFGQKKD